MTVFEYQQMDTAARKGDPVAQHAVGLCYAKGKAVVKDEALAVDWYHRSAGQGYGPAFVNLSDCYAQGAGVTKIRSRPTPMHGWPPRWAQLARRASLRWKVGLPRARSWRAVNGHWASGRSLCLRPSHHLSTRRSARYPGTPDTYGTSSSSTAGFLLVSRRPEGARDDERGHRVRGPTIQ